MIAPKRVRPAEDRPQSLSDRLVVRRCRSRDNGSEADDDSADGVVRKTVPCEH